MDRKGCNPIGRFVVTPVNMPTIIDIPSTSGQDKQTLEIPPNPTPAPIKSRPKLPLYGPLEIHGYEDFMREQKVHFQERYTQLCAKEKSMKAYRYLYILGRGDFSKTVVARKSSEDYTLKIYNKHKLVGKNSVEKVLEEKRILQSLNCPFCTRLDLLYQDRFELIFVLPFLSGGEIFTHLQRNSRFDEHVSRFYAAQVFLALEYLHRCDLIYRDLKPENLLLDHTGYLKLFRFKFAKIVSSKTSTFCGTPEYVAPEMIAGKGYGKSVDWWAFGVLLFEISVGHPPFISANPAKTYKDISAAKYSLPATIGKDLQDLIRKLLQPEVPKRAGTSKKGTEEIKNHKWFREINWMKLFNRRLDPPVSPRQMKASISYHTLIDSDHDVKLPDVDEYFKDF